MKRMKVAKGWDGYGTFLAILSMSKRLILSYCNIVSAYVKLVIIAINEMFFLNVLHFEMKRKKFIRIFELTIVIVIALNIIMVINIPDVQRGVTFYGIRAVSL